MSMISELVKELRRADNPVGGYYRTLYARAADTIEELSAKLATANIERSTAYYNDGWIPCSERLPDKGGTYLVTQERYRLDDRLYKKPVVVETAFAEFNFMNDVWNRARHLKVTAWMPLPEPYKGGGVDGNCKTD